MSRGAGTSLGSPWAQGALVHEQRYRGAELQWQAGPTPACCPWLGSKGSKTSWRRLEQITGADMLQNQGLARSCRDQAGTSLTLAVLGRPGLSQGPGAGP